MEIKENLLEYCRERRRTMKIKENLLEYILIFLIIILFIYTSYFYFEISNDDDFEEYFFNNSQTINEHSYFESLRYTSTPKDSCYFDGCNYHCCNNDIGCYVTLNYCFDEYTKSELNEGKEDG